MSFSTIAGSLLAGYPTERLSQTSQGATFRYRGDYATLQANLPDMGETWADGLPVSGREAYRVGLSDLGELIVETEVSYGGFTLATTLESTRYQISWQPNDLPLELHPAFMPGGASDLFAAASGSPTRKHIADVYGWENEQDPVLRNAYQYKRLESNGTIASTATTLTGGALAYAKLRMLGYSTFPSYLPIWTKVGTYNGTAAPGVGTIGQYTPSGPDGVGFPTGYQWVKIADDAERIGRKPRWERTEAWQGYVKVWLDIDTINPASNTLPP